MMPSLLNESMSPKKTLQQPQASNAPQGQQVNRTKALARVILCLVTKLLT